MKNVIENNKLIAEFMGVNVGYYTTEIEESPTQYHVNDLEYHTSWDWLMPVVEKLSEEYGEMFEPYQFDDLKMYMITNHIEGAYEQAIDFIKWYNENKED